MNIKQALTALCDGPLHDAVNLDEAKHLCITSLQKCTNNPEAVRLAIIVNKSQSLETLQSYIYNAMLRQNGLGVKKSRSF